MRLITSWDSVDFGVLRLEWPHPLLTIPHQYFSINFWFPWICIKIQKIGVFYHFSIFPRYGIWARIQQILKTSPQSKFRKKLMTKFSNKFKKPYFGPFLAHFPHFWSKIFFFFQKYPTLTCTKSLGTLTPRWVSKKTNGPIPRKILDRREGRKDRRREGLKDRRKDR